MEVWAQEYNKQTAAMRWIGGCRETINLTLSSYNSETIEQNRISYLIQVMYKIKIRNIT